MQLNLKYPPLPTNASKFAADMINPALEISGVKLDYSVASLKAVDRILAEMIQDGCTVEQIPETLFGFGCYVGEVFVRHAGGQWRSASETGMEEVAGMPLVVQLGSESFCNPIGKVFKRVESGDEHYLPYFYRVFAPQGASPPRRWWEFWKR